LIAITHAPSLTRFIAGTSAVGIGFHELNRLSCPIRSAKANGDIAFPYFFVRRRLQPISYGPLRRDGFQDVEWLGKQYAGLSHLGYRGYMLRNLDALIKKTSRRVISASDNPNLAISTLF